MNSNPDGSEPTPSVTTPEADDLANEPITRWARQHPDPDKPIFYVFGGRSLTPRDVAREVRQRSRMGQDQISALSELAAEEGISASELMKIFGKGDA